jgi:hypothetical protein
MTKGGSEVAEARTEMMPMPAIALRTKTNAMPSKTAMMRGSSEYYSLRATILDVGKAFLEPQGRVLDLNCADGCWSEPLVQHFGFSQRLIALSSNEEDVNACLNRFRLQVRLGEMEVGTLDLGERFPKITSRLIISVNGLGVLSNVRRQEVLGMIRTCLERKGAFLMIERVETVEERLAALLPAHADMALEERTGRKDREITSRLWSAPHWEEELREAGFRHIDRIWASGPYVGWLASKD